VVPTLASNVGHYLRNASLHSVPSDGPAKKEHTGPLRLDPMWQSLDVPGLLGAREQRRRDWAQVSGHMITTKYDEMAKRLYENHCRAWSGPHRRARMLAAIAGAIREAVEVEREACARMAEGWAHTHLAYKIRERAEGDSER
jgi:hypothetical protein